MLQGKKVNIRTGGDFDPVPMDTYTVQIADVNLVTQFNQFIGKEEEVLNYQFVILDEKEMPEKDDGSEAGTTRGRFLWRRCRTAMNNRSWLGKLAKAAYGRDLTKEEMDDFDPEAIVGKQVRVSVEQAESKDKQQIFNNIVSFAKAIKQLEPIENAAVGAQTPVERASTPVEAPADDPDAFIEGMAKERADVKGKVSAADAEASEAEAEALELEAKAAAAKAKAARAKAAASKKE